MGLEILCVSQFTLYCQMKGNKPDYRFAMGGEAAQNFYTGLASNSNIFSLLPAARLVKVLSRLMSLFVHACLLSRWRKKPFLVRTLNFHSVIPSFGLISLLSDKGQARRYGHITHFLSFPKRGHYF